MSTCSAHLAGIVTRAVYFTPITPNQLTIIAVLFGIAGGILLGGHDAHLAAAAVCFYLKDIFDSADGQLARAKQLYSRRGRFLDSIGDYIVDLFCSAVFLPFFFETALNFRPHFLSVLPDFWESAFVFRIMCFIKHRISIKKNSIDINRITEEPREEDYHEDAVNDPAPKNILPPLRLAGPSYEPSRLVVSGEI